MVAESKSSVMRILMVVIPLGALIIVGTLYGPTIWSNFSTKKFVAVKGKIEFDGNPVNEGFVQIYEIGILGKSKKPRWVSSIGTLNEDGTFNIKTDMNDGAFPGEYVVVVKSMKGNPPVALVPGDYVEIKTSPLRMKVVSDPSKNDFSFTLEGEMNARSRPPEPGSDKDKKGGNDEKGGKDKEDGKNFKKNDDESAPEKNKESNDQNGQ